MRNLWIAAIALASASVSNAAPSSRGGSSSSKPSSELDGHKVCLVKCEGKGQDSSKNILEAVHECNNGGRVVFEKNNEYTIGTALDLTFLNNLEIDIAGEIIFSDDTDYWQTNSFKFTFQNSSSFWLWGGNDVSIYGGGTINGNGQVWYDLYAKDEYIYRPSLIGVEGLHNSMISGLNLKQSPTYHFFVANSTGLDIENIDISSTSDNDNPASNTDGIDLYRSDNVVLRDWIVNNDDDCVSFKPNSTNMLVQNMHCNGSHGISVGSLGQYPGTYSIVENIHIQNVTMTNALTAARVKVWPDVPSTESGNLEGGGGDGIVNNVVFEDFTVESVDYAIEVDQCYGQSNLTLCYDNPSPLKITNVTFKNFQGTTDSKYAPDIATFACSSSTACSNIRAENINVSGPSGSLAYCYNVDTSLLNGVNCTGSYKGFE